jgi:hypothetical protein
MHISGNNFLFGKKFSNDSYYFSKYTHNWGWATWKRAWKHFNFNIDDFEVEWESISNYYKLNEEENIFWVKTFSEIESGRSDVWDAQWLYSVWKSKGYSILPSYNLVTNIGFSSNATHTFQSDSPLSNIKTVNINSLIHPISHNINIQADYISFRKIFLLEFKSSLINRAINFIKRKLFLK